MPSKPPSLTVRRYVPRRSWDHGGKSRHERGYGTAWDKLRAQVLADEPMCRSCLHEHGIVTAANQVDHIKAKAKGGTDDRSNLRPLCRPCHDRKSAADRGHRVRPTIGEDGWPVDPA